jgi:hypothetical protein
VCPLQYQFLVCLEAPCVVLPSSLPQKSCSMRSCCLSAGQTSFVSSGHQILHSSHTWTECPIRLCIQLKIQSLSEDSLLQQGRPSQRPLGGTRKVVAVWDVGVGLGGSKQEVWRESVGRRAFSEEAGGWRLG